MASERVRGYVLGAVAAASYGLNPLFALPMYAAGMGADSVLFYRYVLAVALLGVLMLVRRRSFALHRRDVVPLVVMGLLMSASSLLLFESYHFMDAGVASTILFVYPVMVAVIMAVGFHERLTAASVLSIALACAGISLLYKGGDGATLNLTGVVLVFFSALSYAVYIVGVNRSSLRTMSTEKLTFYCLLFGSLIYVVRLRGCTELQPVPEPLLWINALSLALFPTVISLVAMAGAIRRIGSTPTAILGALEPVTALIFGVTVFGEQLTPRIMLGVVLILVAVTLIIAGQSLHFPDAGHTPCTLDGPSAPAVLGRALGAQSAAAAPALPELTYSRHDTSRAAEIIPAARLISICCSRVTVCCGLRPIRLRRSSCGRPCPT